MSSVAVGGTYTRVSPSSTGAKQISTSQDQQRQHARAMRPNVSLAIAPLLVRMERSALTSQGSARACPISMARNVKIGIVYGRNGPATLRDPRAVATAVTRLERDGTT